MATSRIQPEVVAAVRHFVEMEREFGVSELSRSGSVDSVSGIEAMDPHPLPDETVISPPVLKTLDTITERIASCRDCPLCEGRVQTVPGQGSGSARLMFVGEAPGYNEDQTGLAFVGRAGELLTKMITAMEMDRDEVFIANILKCRPPDNRDPEGHEVDACLHYLLDQIDIIRPDVICTLGAHATNNLLDRSDPMYKLRGRVFPFKGVHLVPTYHPSYLLRSPDKKRDAWNDLQVVMELLDTGTNAGPSA